MAETATDGPVRLAAVARRVGRQVSGLVLVTYGLAHLVIWPGAPTGEGDERLRWNGDSWVEAWVPRAAVEACGGVLLTVAVLGCVAGGVGVLRTPGVRRFWRLAAGTAAGCSLGLFPLVWPGLEPEPREFAAGPVLSGMLLATVVGSGLARRRAARRADRSRPAGRAASGDRGSEGRAGQAGAAEPPPGAPSSGVPSSGAMPSRRRFRRLPWLPGR